MWGSDPSSSVHSGSPSFGWWPGWQVHSVSSTGPSQELPIPPGILVPRASRGLMSPTSPPPLCCMLTLAVSEQGHSLTLLGFCWSLPGVPSRPALPGKSPSPVPPPCNSVGLSPTPLPCARSSLGSPRPFPLHPLTDAQVVCLYGPKDAADPLFLFPLGGTAGFPSPCDPVGVGDMLDPWEV